MILARYGREIIEAGFWKYHPYPILEPIEKRLELLQFLGDRVCQVKLIVIRAAKCKMLLILLLNLPGQRKVIFADAASKEQNLSRSIHPFEFFFNDPVRGHRESVIVDSIIDQNLELEFSWALG
jgi:hypothetical protein